MCVGLHSLDCGIRAHQRKGFVALGKSLCSCRPSCSHLKMVMIVEPSDGDAVGNNMVAVCLSLAGTVLSRILPSLAFVSDFSCYNEVLF